MYDAVESVSLKVSGGIAYSQCWQYLHSTDSKDDSDT